MIRPSGESSEPRCVSASSECSTAPSSRTRFVRSSSFETHGLNIDLKRRNMYFPANGTSNALKRNLPAEQPLMPVTKRNTHAPSRLKPAMPADSWICCRIIRGTPCSPTISSYRPSSNNPAPANARIMIHQPSGGGEGTAADVEIQAKEVLYLRERLNAVLAERTGQTIEQIAKDTDRDNFMSAASAKEYGLIDDVLMNRAALGEF